MDEGGFVDGGELVFEVEYFGEGGGCLVGVVVEIDEEFVYFGFLVGGDW